MMFVGFEDTFTQLTEILSYSWFATNFYNEWRLRLIKCEIFLPTEMITSFLVFILKCDILITLIKFQMLNKSCFSETKLTWLKCIMLVASGNKVLPTSQTKFGRVTSFSIFWKN